MGIVQELSAAAPRYEPPRPIQRDDKVSQFKCGKEALDDFIRTRASKNEGRASRTYVVCTANGGATSQVVAYYSLAAGAVTAEECPGWAKRNMPNPIPVVVLGRLAVDHRHAGKGIGKALLKEAMQRTLEASQQIGVRALIVHAIDDEAISFYAPFGFQRFPTDGRTLFLPVETILGSI